MTNVKDDMYYLNKIVSDLEFIINHTSNIEQSELENNEILVDSILFRIIQIAENNNKLSDDFKKTYSNVPWNAIKGMRNRIVHDYGEVSMLIVYDTVTNGIPNMYNAIKDLIM